MSEECTVIAWPRDDPEGSGGGGGDPSGIDHPERATREDEPLSPWALKSFALGGDQVALRHWASLRAAEKLCAVCADIGRCRRWLDEGLDEANPCPNSELFDEVIRALARRALGDDE